MSSKNVKIIKEGYQLISRSTNVVEERGYQPVVPKTETQTPRKLPKPNTGIGRK